MTFPREASSQADFPPAVEKGRKSREKISGFSLIQVSGIVAVAGIVMAASLPGSAGSSVDQRAVTVERMKRIEDAMRGFMIANQRLPCPADASQASTSATFGVEEATPGTCTAPYVGDTLRNATSVAGILPVRALGLPDEFAFDGYGRRFTYVVDLAATSQTGCRDKQSQSTKGAIQILSTSTSTSPIDETMWAVLSYGEKAHGAFPAHGSTVANRLNVGLTDADSRYNAFVNALFAVSYQSALVKKEPSGSGVSRFDDIVWYSQGLQNNCALGKQALSGTRINEMSTAAANDPQNMATGDFNGDGIADIAYRSGTAEIKVIFGAKTGWPVSGGMNDNTLTGTNGFTLTTATVTSMGLAGVLLGDFNGDRYDDLYVEGNANAAMLFGGPGLKTGASSWASSWAATLDTSALNGTNGFRITGTPSRASINSSTMIAMGDVNGDGFMDIATAAATGNTYVVLGGSSWASGSYALTGGGSLTSTNGFTISGLTPVTNGVAIGDFNNNGVDDLLLGGYTGGATGYNYILFGRAFAAGSTLDLALETASTVTGIRFTLSTSDTGFGTYQWAADVNKDGCTDLLMKGTSNIYVYFGCPSGGWTTPVLLSSAMNGTSGFLLDLATSKPSWAIFTDMDLAVDDINNDGRKDILIAGWDSDANSRANSGSVFVIMQPTSWGSTYGVWGLSFNGISAMRIDGGAAGDRIAEVRTGDLNKDGARDIHMIGIGTRKIYTVFGRNTVPWDGTIDLVNY